MREATQRILSSQEHIQVIGTAVDGEDAVNQAAELRPQVVILDIKMPKMNGIEAAHQITSNKPGTGIVVVSSYDDTEYIVDLLKNGPEGKAYLLKQSIDNVNEWTHAIESVAAGCTVLDPAIAEKLSREYSLHKLTDHEQWVLALLAAGYSDFVISTTIHIDMATVAEIVESLSEKLPLIPGDTNLSNIQAVLALVDPYDRLRPAWVAGYPR